VGAVLYSMGRVEEAIKIYTRWVELEPNDPRARHMLASCTGDGVPERASDAFVTQTFDTFAGSFDQVLEKLQYRAPALIIDAVTEVFETFGAPAAALDVLDAGAGTGWCGPPLRPYARRLVGVDLSAGMLAKAAERKISDSKNGDGKVYDELVTSELVAYMRAHPAAYDLIVSADTLVYFGDLGAAMQAAAATLRPGGHFIYTVEHAVDEPATGHRLNPHGRYSHGEAYVRRVLGDAGLEPLSVNRVHLRLEVRVPVDGLLVVARKRPSA
jgi:predicted TPR repeat methyltransferase